MVNKNNCRHPLDDGSTKSSNVFIYTQIYLNEACYPHSKDKGNGLEDNLKSSLIGILRHHNKL